VQAGHAITDRGASLKNVITSFSASARYWSKIAAGLISSSFIVESQGYVMVERVYLFCTFVKSVHVIFSGILGNPVDSVAIIFIGESGYIMVRSSGIIMTPTLSPRKAIGQKRFSLGSWIQLPDVFSAEIMARSGFDWLAIDLEHGLIDLKATYQLIQVISLNGCVPLVRLNENDSSLIRRVMDAGAGGVIVPMINTAEEARRVVKAVKYSPAGERSYGLGRAHDFGKEFDSYIRSSNETSIVVVQIEHIDALKNLDEILTVKGIDAIIIGPYDLTGSMGIPGQFDNPKFEEIIHSIIQKVKKSGVALGIHIVHISDEDLQRRISEGFTFIGYGMDSLLIAEGSKTAVNIARQRFGEKS
jgi:2-keto-3-deoxy-L-rhamnonate aldolase RhmA